jgi:hypothetical protein
VVRYAKTFEPSQAKIGKFKRRALRVFLLGFLGSLVF